MVNETASASENADVNVEVMRNAAKKTRRHAHGDRGRLADGHGRLDRRTHPAPSVYHRRRRVGLRIGGLYCPRPSSVHHHHDCRTHFPFFDVHHLHRPSFVCHCRRIRCHRDNFAVCPAPSILGGPGTRRVIHGLRCVGSQPRHPDDCDTCLYHRSYGISCANLVKESVVALSKEEVADVIEEESTVMSRVQSLSRCLASADSFSSKYHTTSGLP